MMSVIKNQGMTSAVHSFRTDTVLLHTIYQESKTGKEKKRQREKEQSFFHRGKYSCRFITQP